MREVVTKEAVQVPSIRLIHHIGIDKLLAYLANRQTYKHTSRVAEEKQTETTGCI